MLLRITKFLLNNFFSLEKDYYCLKPPHFVGVFGCLNYEILSQIICISSPDSYDIDMLELTNISVSVEEKLIVENFSFSFSPGNIYALLGKNGSGKSSLAFALFRHPRYTVSGEISLHGTSLL